jgi:hypothetical protein
MGEISKDTLYVRRKSFKLEELSGMAMEEVAFEVSYEE